jgi:hypothetical protein
MDRPRGNKADRPRFEPGCFRPLFHGRNEKEIVMLLPLTITSRLSFASSNGLAWTSQSWNGLARQVVMASATVAAYLVASASTAHGQVVMYETFRPVTSYYSPVAVGYAPVAVTAFSPPVATGYVANYPVASYPVTQVANYAVETVSSPVNVTSYYAPAPAMPVMAAPVYAAPVTTYYAPSAVAVPLYRRGLFGGLRPARTAMYIPY